MQVRLNKSVVHEGVIVLSKSVGTINLVQRMREDIGGGVMEDVFRASITVPNGYIIIGGLNQFGDKTPGAVTIYAKIEDVEFVSN